MRVKVSLVLLVALWTFFTCTSADFVAESTLCDDIEAICEHFYKDSDPYTTNETICGEETRVLNPTTCNCGYLCMGSIEEDDSCRTGSPKKFPESVCGYGLECLSEEITEENAVCIPNPEKECINGTLNYDYGEPGPGQLRPNCRDDGSYAGRQCSPGSTCYCVDKNNTRLFGETPTTAGKEMDCACALYWQDTEARGLDDGLRCLINGNFDPLFCAGDMCYCYDSVNDKMDGPYGLSMLINIPCYNSTIHNPNYINICTQNQDEYDTRSNTTLVVDANRRPVCTRDGYYTPIRAMGPSAYCVDPYGEPIENFLSPLYAFDEMTCNCARRRYFMDKAGLGSSKPKCCPNGDYYTYQTRGLLAYCVDTNGNQVGEAEPITNVEALLCDYADPCPSISLYY